MSQPAVATSPLLNVPLRSMAQVMREKREQRGVWVNVYESSEGFLSSTAHPSEVDCLDCISDERDGWKYVETIIRKDGKAEIADLSSEASAYMERIVRERFYEERHEAGLRSLSNKF